MGENGGHVKFEGQDSRRVADMQLGKAKWVRILDNIAYIVAGVILRENNGQIEVLLIQEAKQKVYGKWYIPSGHVEAGETIENAVKREVKEETGFECTVDNLLSLEVRGSGWYRFSFFCSVTGGEIKKTPNKESLSADWHSIEVIKRKGIEVRANDFVKVVEEGVKFYSWQKSIGKTISDYPKILNQDLNENGLFTEFVIVKLSSTSERTEVLVHQSIKDQLELLSRQDAFPTVEFGFEYFFPVMVSKCYKHILEDGTTAMDPPSAVLATTCLPSPIEAFNHGLRTRILCYHKKTFTKSPLVDPRRYHWIEMTESFSGRSPESIPGRSSELFSARPPELHSGRSPESAPGRSPESRIHVVSARTSTNPYSSLNILCLHLKTREHAQFVGCLSFALFICLTVVSFMFFGVMSIFYIIGGIVIYAFLTESLFRQPKVCSVTVYLIFELLQVGFYIAATIFLFAMLLFPDLRKSSDDGGDNDDSPYSTASSMTSTAGLTTTTSMTTSTTTLTTTSTTPTAGSTTTEPITTLSPHIFYQQGEILIFKSLGDSDTGGSSGSDPTSDEEQLTALSLILSIVAVMLLLLIKVYFIRVFTIYYRFLCYQERHSRELRAEYVNGRGVHLGFVVNPEFDNPIVNDPGYGYGIFPTTRLPEPPTYHEAMSTTKSLNPTPEQPSVPTETTTPTPTRTPGQSFSSHNPEDPPHNLPLQSYQNYGQLEH
ncbi:hypothetical protein FO519_005091 [Halicephalobus sp. NKZ332]|nr:hypothetical protein FO519_005091 [Halicephalobus sp. NKZ332]